jgi:hypothetical protein
MVGVTAEKRKEVQAAEKRSRRVEQREQRKTQWYNNKQSNMQKHFRVSSQHSVPQVQLLTISRILCSSDLDRVVSKFFALGSSVSGVVRDDLYLGRWLVWYCMVWEFRDIRRRNKVSEFPSIEAASKNRLHTFNR